MEHATSRIGHLVKLVDATDASVTQDKSSAKWAKKISRAGRAMPPFYCRTSREPVASNRDLVSHKPLDPQRTSPSRRYIPLVGRSCVHTVITHRLENVFLSCSNYRTWRICDLLVPGSPIKSTLISPRYLGPPPPPPLEILLFVPPNI